jgi:hypothetical protein
MAFRHSFYFDDCVTLAGGYFKATDLRGFLGVINYFIDFWQGLAFLSQTSFSRRTRVEA